MSQWLRPAIYLVKCRRLSKQCKRFMGQEYQEVRIFLGECRHPAMIQDRRVMKKIIHGKVEPARGYEEELPGISALGIPIYYLLCGVGQIMRENDP